MELEKMTAQDNQRFTHEADELASPTPEMSSNSGSMPLLGTLPMKRASGFALHEVVNGTAAGPLDVDGRNIGSQNLRLPPSHGTYGQSTDLQVVSDENKSAQVNESSLEAFLSSRRNEQSDARDIRKTYQRASIIIE